MPSYSLWIIAYCSMLQFQITLGSGRMPEIGGKGRRWRCTGQFGDLGSFNWEDDCYSEKTKRYVYSYIAIPLYLYMCILCVQCVNFMYIDKKVNINAICPVCHGITYSNAMTAAVHKPGPVFCPLLGISSGCAWPIIGQVISVTWPVIGWT